MLTDTQFRDLASGRWRGPLPALLRGLCSAAEVPYGSIVRHRNALFDRGRREAYRVAAPIISVGNLTVGGTGKTPLVAWIAQWLQLRGTAVTLISRGYGSANGRPNDEALELAARLPGVPHLQNPDRIAAAEQALQQNPRQVLLLDDAFQHRRLARDLDIVLLDALEPFGHERLLPRGLLREPVSSLARAHVVALSRSDAIDEPHRRQIKARVQSVAPSASWIELVHQPSGLVSFTGERVPLDEFDGKRIAAFCGIGNPTGFRHTLSRRGLTLVDLLAMPDHCPYGPGDIARIERWLATLPAAEVVVCTRKDLVKIPRSSLAGRPLFALEISIEIRRGQAELEARLAAMEKSLLTSTG
jgi:tetraacyldisaccharide 4'-kinase